MQNKHFFIIKKGLFVGSFNPITLAHESIASELLKEKILDYIYFLPVNSKKQDLISIDKRIDMINIITKENQSVLNIYNYSKEGLFNIEILQKIKLGITHIIMGSDLFLKFNKFKNYQEILTNYYLIIINRGTDINEYIKKNYQDYQDKIIIIDKTYIGSSKLAKDNLKESYNKYLNDKVLDYIKRNNLYN
ncbi:MAG: nicotinate-nicotinamide nucleotide adenylyltransferase [Bacilli bacterium]|nr:nicotinate-nicotinamide nucleotide adenylyltransferase [Bacilli bacterium]